jgi:putative endonuclease
VSRKKGAHYETLALNHLKANGLKLIEKNFQCRLGEIDLILRERDCLVFAEVRYRASNRYACAAHSVDERKQAKIARTAAIYLSQRPELADCTVRFDIVAIDDVDSSPNTLQWMRDAFRV